MREVAPESKRPWPGAWCGLRVGCECGSTELDEVYMTLRRISAEGLKPCASQKGLAAASVMRAFT